MAVAISALVHLRTLCSATGEEVEKRVRLLETGQWYKPQASWLQSLYAAGKLRYCAYITTSATLFPIGQHYHHRWPARTTQALQVDSAFLR